MAAVTEVTGKVTPWGSLFIFSFPLSWRPSRAHFLSSATSAAVSSCQQENQSFVNPTGSCSLCYWKAQSWSTLRHPLCFPPLDHNCGWLLKGTHRAPSLYLGFFCCFFFLVIQSIFSVFFTCAGNEIGEADRQDENIIPTSKGKQKIHFGQIQDSCM